MNITRKFRNVWQWLVPGWLQSGQGEMVLFVQGLLKDAFAERMHQSARLHAPSLCPSDALDLHGSSRALIRGLFEPEASYRGRLVAWRYPYGHRVRGTARGLLDQISVALRGTEWTTVDARGTQVQLDSDGTATVTRDVTWDWDGEALLPNWGRYWLVVQSGGEAWPSFDDGAWGDSVDNPDVCLAGDGIHPGELDAVRRLVSNGSLGWTPAGRRAIYLVIYFDGSPYPAPTGDWDEWPNRDQQYRYVPLHSSVT